MPGPVSDSFDPEWTTSSNRQDIADALSVMHSALGVIIGSGPKYILDVVHTSDLDAPVIECKFTEKELRVLRFACERAKESL